jgi:hypothetical protein
MKQRILLIIISAILLSGCSIPFLQKTSGALQITTKPDAEVYLDSEKAGETPFKNDKLQVKDYSLRLAPLDSKLAEWQTTVTLHSSITTVINYEFAEERQMASGVVLTLEPQSNKESIEIAVISIPDNASVKLDGQPKGFAPLQVKNITEGEHTLVIAAPGYKQRQIEIKAVKGHKLTVDVQLAKDRLLQEESSEEVTDEKKKKDEKEEEGSDIITPTPTKEKLASPSAEIERPYVEILDTPTGWLRVRSDPTTVEDNEIAKINPGERYKYLESNDSGWHKILLDEGEEGWISGRYSNVFK